jgi:DNA-binding SARP family transcriptional activator
MARLAIRVLGSFQANLDGELIGGFHSDKVRALLAYLCVEGKRPHRREKLAGLLWPDLPECSARTNLRHALANLRQVIGNREANPTFLSVTRQTIQFNSDSDIWADALAFTSALLSLQGSIPQLEKAISWYHGEFLEGFSLPDSSIFEEWLLLQREHFQRLALDALHQLTTGHTEQNEYERALTYAWRQLDLDPWREKAYRQVIHLLALSGHRSEALAQYNKCRLMLAEELGVDPSIETTRLYEQIRDEALTVTMPSADHHLGPTHNLPVAPGPFVGREAEIAQIQNCLRDSACRLLTLIGAGGIGKTRLALEAVADWLSQAREETAHRLRHGVYLVRLAPLQAVEAIVPTIAQAIGFQFAPGREPHQQLLETLSRKRMLLILDNFEHLMASVELVAEMLRSAPHLTVLITSRSRLNLQGEQIFPVGGIDFPEQAPDDAQIVQGFAAVELFLQTARQVRPGFEPTNADLMYHLRKPGEIPGKPKQVTDLLF